MNLISFRERILSPRTLYLLDRVFEARNRGESLTMREICALLDSKSPHLAKNYVDRLCKLGLLTMEPFRKGTLRPSCRFVPVAELYPEEKR